MKSISGMKGKSKISSASRGVPKSKYRLSMQSNGPSAEARRKNPYSSANKGQKRHQPSQTRASTRPSKILRKRLCH